MPDPNQIGRKPPGVAAALAWGGRSRPRDHAAAEEQMVGSGPRTCTHRLPPATDGGGPRRASAAPPGRKLRRRPSGAKIANAASSKGVRLAAPAPSSVSPSWRSPPSLPLVAHLSGRRPLRVARHRDRAPFRHSQEPDQRPGRPRVSSEAAAARAPRRSSGAQRLAPWSASATDDEQAPVAGAPARRVIPPTGRPSATPASTPSATGSPRRAAHLPEAVKGHLHQARGDHGALRATSRT
jgi:hypothetical protein